MLGSVRGSFPAVVHGYITYPILLDFSKLLELASGALI